MTQAANDLTEAEVFGPVGYISRCLAHIRAGYPIDELDGLFVLYVTPTQADVEHARVMADALLETPDVVFGAL
ncbi:hypothetical protein AB0N17_03575 [Streptomyces sp. NPDC051133]|uniref:hypothetical protein n=1 Tax=Streptomyces sp. NPDC051133 TaxID=3155521 RepID=UPI00341256A1